MGMLGGLHALHSAVRRRLSHRDVQFCGQWGDVWACSAGSCSNGVCQKWGNGPSPELPGGGWRGGELPCGRRRTESCCTSLEVPGGTPIATYDHDALGWPALAADGGPMGVGGPGTVSDFRLDKYLVTVGRFRQFVAAWNNGAGWLPVGGLGEAHAPERWPGSGEQRRCGDVRDGVGGDGRQRRSRRRMRNLTCEPPYNTWTPSAGTQENLPINCVNWYEAYAFCIWDGHPWTAKF